MVVELTWEAFAEEFVPEEDRQYFLDAVYEAHERGVDVEGVVKRGIIAELRKNNPDWSLVLENDQHKQEKGNDGSKDTRQQDL